MQGHYFYASRARLVAAVVASLVLVGGQGRPVSAHAPVPEEAQSVELDYACGNSFVVSSTFTRPVTVSFRVAGTKEEGSVMVEAAPDDDPYFSEAFIDTRNRGRVALFLDGQRVSARDNGGVPCPPPAPQAAQAAAAAATIDAGQWSAPFPWPTVAVHLHLLPNGRVLTWGSPGPGNTRPEGAVPKVWTPSSGSFADVPIADYLFCSGHAFLQDGRLLVVGGHITDSHGLPDTNLFSPGAGWTSSAPMQRGRWYPTATTMGNSQVVILAGRDEDAVHVPVPEVWTSGSIRRLTGASRTMPMYPRAFLAPNGRLFYAGEQATTRYLNITGAGQWSTVGNRRTANREYGSAVMYDVGRILYAGGGRTTNSAEIIDLNQSKPAWRATGSMAFARRQHNLTVLPTGEVLATGGVAGTAFNDLSKPVRAAELWNPATGTWRTLASSSVTRGYHGTSILLPDGRVLHTGSGDGAGAPRELNAELFSPPYLFNGARPTISTAPGTARYGTTFRVTTPNASAITKISLIRLGSVTHAFDMNQRYQTLSFTKDATGLTVTAPTSRNRTPPGHYMLFILNGSGVPSVAKIVQVR